MVTPPTTDNGGAGEQTRKYFRVGNGHKDVGDLLCQHWNDEVEHQMEENRALAKEQVKTWKGTYDRTKSRKDEAMTFQVLINTLASGLTGDGEGQLDIIRGKVYFKRDKLESLKKKVVQPERQVQPDMALGETCVKFDGVVYPDTKIESRASVGVDQSSPCTFLTMFLT